MSKDPEVTVHIGRKRYRAAARVLDEADSRAALAEFARRKPVEGRLAMWLGMAAKPVVMFAGLQVLSDHAHDSLTSL